MACKTTLIDTQCYLWSLVITPGVHVERLLTDMSKESLAVLWTSRTQVGYIKMLVLLYSG